MGEDFSIGRVISRAFSVVGKNAVTFFLLALVVQLPASAMNFYNVATTSPGLSQAQILARTFSPQGLTILGITTLVYLVLALILQASILRGAITSLGGRTATLVECLSTGLSVFFPMIAITILTMLGAMLGFILLIIPGIMLLLRWSVSIPVRIMEGPGILKSMGRSAELTRGHRWAIFGTLIVFGIMSIGLSIVVALVATTTGGAGQSVVSIVTSAIVGMISIVFGAAASASIYYELRSIKDGVGAEQLAAVFA